MEEKKNSMAGEIGQTRSVEMPTRKPCTKSWNTEDQTPNDDAINNMGHYVQTKSPKEVDTKY